MVFVAKMYLKVCKFYEELIKSDPLVQTVVCRFHCSWSSSTETCDGGGLISVAYLSTIDQQKPKFHKTSNKARCQSTQLDEERQCVLCNGIHCVAQNFVAAFLPASALNELVVDKFSFLFREICILT